MRTANRLRQMPKQTREVYVKPLLKVESTLTNQIEGLLALVPIYTDFLYNVKGVGPRISGSIIANTMIRFEKIFHASVLIVGFQFTVDPLLLLGAFPSTT